MGADFKEKSKKTFEKCWDRAAVEANTPDLFKKSAEHAPSRFEAEPIGDLVLTVGDCAIVRVEEGKIIGRQGVSPVLTVLTPTAELRHALDRVCEVARADVVSVDPISGTYEITLH